LLTRCLIDRLFVVFSHIPPLHKFNGTILSNHFGPIFLRVQCIFNSTIFKGITRMIEI
jgi:hypothetical protein